MLQRKTVFFNNQGILFILLYFCTIERQKEVNRYFIYLAYKGTRYCGWQRQPNGLSVQQCLEETRSIILQEYIPVVGAGRTDAGVHARLMVAHFECSVLTGNFLQLADKLNRMLPDVIAVSKIVAVT